MALVFLLSAGLVCVDIDITQIERIFLARRKFFGTDSNVPMYPYDRMYGEIHSLMSCFECSCGSSGQGVKVKGRQVLGARKEGRAIIQQRASPYFYCI